MKRKGAGRRERTPPRRRRSWRSGAASRSDWARFATVRIWEGDLAGGKRLAVARQPVRRAALTGMGRADHREAASRPTAAKFL